MYIFLSHCLPETNKYYHTLLISVSILRSLVLNYITDSVTCYLDSKFCILKLLSVHSGLLSTAGYAVYAQHVAVEYFNPNFDDLKWVAKIRSSAIPAQKTAPLTLRASPTAGTIWEPRCSWAGLAPAFTWLVVSSTCGQCARRSVGAKKREYPNSEVGNGQSVVSQQLLFPAQQFLCLVLLFNA